MSDHQGLDDDEGIVPEEGSEGQPLSQRGLSFTQRMGTLAMSQQPSITIVNRSNNNQAFNRFASNGSNSNPAG